MKKPVPETQTAYDFNECTKYIEKKYKFDTRDYARSKTKDKNAPYQDFWHYIIEQASPSNGSYFMMSDEWFDDDEITDWQKEILEIYLSEFATEHIYSPDVKTREIAFYVWW